MQPYLFPYIGYFQLINFVDKFVIYDDVNYIKKGWINRNRILTNDKENLFTVPLKKASQNKLIKDIEISDEKKSTNHLSETIFRSYKKAPFFDEAFGLISEILNSGEKTIAKFNFLSLKKLCAYLAIETNIIESSSVYSNSNLKQQERIIDICKKENADHYINLSGGRDLYSTEIFKSHEIKLNFMKSSCISYKQFNNEFKDSLSIIDVLMFNSKSKIMEFLGEYELI